MSKWNGWNASNKCFDSSYMECLQKQMFTIPVSTKTKFNRKTNLERNQMNKAVSEFSLGVVISHDGQWQPLFFLEYVKHLEQPNPKIVRI